MIFCIMGKSGSGKSTIAKELVKRNEQFFRVKTYTTRPQRDSESGDEYIFVTDELSKWYESHDRIIQKETYNGWLYFVVDDGQITYYDMDYIITGTVDRYEALRKFYGDENVTPIYIDVDDKTRILRSIQRNDLREVCRRFLDEKDLPVIQPSFKNYFLDTCIESIEEFIFVRKEF